MFPKNLSGFVDNWALATLTSAEQSNVGKNLFIRLLMLSYLAAKVQKEMTIDFSFRLNILSILSKRSANGLQQANGLLYSRHIGNDH